MLFKGVSSSKFVRAAYVLVILSFLTLPIHFLVDRRSVLQGALLAASTVVFVFSLAAAIMSKPRDVRLAVFALLAWIIHGAVIPAI
jgi:hypothetical protein